MKSNEVIKFEELFGIELTERELMIFNYLNNSKKTNDNPYHHVRIETYKLRYISKTNLTQKIKFLAKTLDVEADYTVYESGCGINSVVVSAKGTREKIDTFFEKL